MIKCFILDDEKNCLIALRQLLLKQGSDIEIIGESSSPVITSERFASGELKPDLLFLDIQMPEKDGFSFLESLPKIDFSVIFTTAYDQYAIKAIKCAALDYLLKPVNKNELEIALEKFRSLHAAQHTQRLLQLKNNISAGNLFDKLAIPTLSEIRFVQTSDIYYLESDNNYTAIHMNEKTPLLSSKNIGHYEEVLEHLGFFRIHNSYLVNLKKIVRYFRGKAGYVELENGIRLEISKRKKDQFLQFLELI